MALCRVTGTVYLPNGSLAVNRQIVFRREKKDITAEYLGALFPDDVWQFTNAQGQIDVTLLTGRYVAFAQAPQRAYFGIVTVPDAPTANFADIIGDFEIPETPPVWYNQALQARDDAEAAAEAATGYATRYEAEGASVPSAVNTLRIGYLAYVRDDDGTALITADGQHWSPDGTITPLHFGAVGDGVADDADALEASLEWAARLPSLRVDVDGLGREYGLGRTVSLTYGSGVYLDNIKLKAVGLAEFPLVHGMTGPLLFVDFHDFFGSGNVTLDCNWLSSGMLIRESQGVHIGPGFFAFHWAVNSDLSYGFRTTSKAGELYAERLRVQQYLWGEDNFFDPAFRSGYGIKIETADCILIGLIASACKYPFHKSGSGAWQLIAPHVFQGYGEYDVGWDNIHGVYIDEPSNGVITGGNMDGCPITVGADRLDSTIMGTLQISDTWFLMRSPAVNACDQLRFITGVSNNDLAGLTLSNLRFDNRSGDRITFKVTGSGSYASRLKWAVYGVRGRVVLPQGISTLFSASQVLSAEDVGDGASLEAAANLILMADADVNSPDDNSAVFIGNDGIRHSRFRGGNFYTGTLPSGNYKLTIQTSSAGQTGIFCSRPDGTVVNGKGIYWDEATESWNLGFPSGNGRIRSARRGTTAQRPTGSVSGEDFFDTTIGKPIWWNGTVWVDASGVAV